MFPAFQKTRMLTPVPGERHTDSTVRVFLFCFAVFGVFGLGQALASVALQLIAPDAGAAVSMLVSLFSTMFTVAGVLVWCLCFERRTMTTLGFIRRGAVLDYLVGVVLGVLLIGASLGACVATGAATVTVADPAPSWGMLALFLVGFLIQGLSEEMLCRSHLMVSLSRKRPLWFCAVGNALFFSLLHIANPGVTVIALLNIFLFGLFASILILRRGSIWMAAAIHSLWNFAQGNLFGIPVSGLTGTPSPLRTEMPAETTLQALINGGSFGLEGGLAVTVVLAVAIFVVLLVPTKKSEVVVDVATDTGADTDSQAAETSGDTTAAECMQDGTDADSSLPTEEPVQISAREQEILTANKWLYHKLIATPGLEGEFTFDGHFIRWDRPSPGVVDPPYLIISLHHCKLGNDYMAITDWHPEDEGGVEELYAFLCEAGRPGHVLVARKTGPVFVGPRDVYEADESLKNRMMITYFFG